MEGGNERGLWPLRIGSRNSWENAKRQVWNTILKREAVAMVRIHVCDACAAPCDDPEDQMVVAIGREGSGFTGGTVRGPARAGSLRA